MTLEIMFNVQKCHAMRLLMLVPIFYDGQHRLTTLKLKNYSYFSIKKIGKAQLRMIKLMGKKIDTITINRTYVTVCFNWVQKPTFNLVDHIF